MKYETEIHRRVYDNDAGQYLTVRPSPDFPGENVVLMSDPSEEDYWGKLRLDIPADMAIEVGKALIDSAQAILKAKGYER